VICEYQGVSGACPESMYCETSLGSVGVCLPVESEVTDPSDDTSGTDDGDGTDPEDTDDDDGTDSEDTDDRDETGLEGTGDAVSVTDDEDPDSDAVVEEEDVDHEDTAEAENEQDYYPPVERGSSGCSVATQGVTSRSIIASLIQFIFTSI